MRSLKTTICIRFTYVLNAEIQLGIYSRSNPQILRDNANFPTLFYCLVFANARKFPLSNCLSLSTTDIHLIQFDLTCFFPLFRRNIMNVFRLKLQIRKISAITLFRCGLVNCSNPSRLFKYSFDVFLDFFSRKFHSVYMITVIPLYYC